MACNCVLARDQYSGHPATIRCDGRVADRVNASVHRVQAAALDASANGLAGDPGFQ
jgi:hypothetical protein